MHQTNDSNSPNNVEQTLYEANDTLNQLVAQTPQDVQEMEAMFGTTQYELPASLRDASTVLERIIQSAEASRSPTAFGQLVSLMRTKRKLTIEQLAEKTDLDVDELHEIETCPDVIPEPMAVSVLATFFKLAPKKVQRLAGLVRESVDDELTESLGIAAGAKPEFSQLSKQERKLFHQWVKYLRK